MRRYNLRSFTDTNSVICKIIVGTPVLGCPRTPQERCPYEKRRKIYESNRGAMGAPPVAESSDLSEWQRSTAAKERRRRRQMWGTATGIVRRVDDLGRIVIPKEIRRTLRICEGDPSRTTLTPIDKFSWAIHSVVNRYKETAE